MPTYTGDGIDLSNARLYLKDRDGDYVEFSGITEVSIDDMQSTEGDTDGDEKAWVLTTAEPMTFSGTIKASLSATKSFMKEIRRWRNKEMRLQRYWRRMLERMRRARLKGKPYIRISSKYSKAMTMRFGKDER